MNQVLKLFKLQLDEKYDILKTNNKKKMLWSIFKYFLLLAALTIVFYVLFLRLSLVGFVVNRQLVSIILLVTQIISLFFAVGHIINTLYQNKNNELLMSLPASPNQVFLSKIILSYVQEVIMNTVFTLPLLISVGLLGGPARGFGVYYYLIMPLAMLILPLVPLALASLLSVPMNFVLKFFKRNITLSIITIVILVAGFIYLYVTVISGFANGFNIASKQIETVRNINNGVVDIGNNNVFYLLLADGITRAGKIWYLLVFTALGGAVLTLTFFIIRPFFFKMAMSSLENSTSKIKIGSYKKRTPFASLILKEFLTVFRSSGNVFDYFLFTLLMPFIVVVYDNMLLGMVVNQSGQIMINGAHLLIVAVFATLANIYSASAISREGVNFYITKTAPVNFYTQTLAKVTFNAIFSVGAIVITGIITMFYMNFWVCLLTTLICVFISLGHIFYCFDIDLKKPTLDWFDSGDISKINKNTTKAIIYGLIVALIFGMFIMLTTGLGIWSFIILLVASIIFCGYRAYVLILRVFYQYERLEM